jgi:hypothetical protein
MNHRKFVVTSTVSMLIVAGVVAGLAFYSNVVVKASIPGLPEAVSHLPANSQVVFGMNVQKFVSSPIFLKFQQEHGQEIGTNLQEFITVTGVDPVKDLSYIVAAGRANEGKNGAGVIIAIAYPNRKFNADGIANYIQTRAKTVPMALTYKNVRVLMISEAEGNKLEKGVAFVNDSEMALGDLDSLKAVIDASISPSTGIEANTTLAPLINSLNAGQLDQMFWFAGDAASILSKAPTNTPFGGSIAAIQSIVGALNLSDAVAGKIVATARDADSAQKLADIGRGFVALGQLAGDQNPDLGELLKGINISLDTAKNQVSLVLNFPFDLLDRLKQAKPLASKKI